VEKEQSWKRGREAKYIRQVDVKEIDEEQFWDLVGVRGHLSISLLPLSSPTLPLFICTPSPHLCIISRDYTQRPTTFALIVQ
jgi:hypothetical protein